MEKSKVQKQSAEKMGTMEVHPLLLSMAIPLIISMLVQALYNIVDSIFVARISEDALSAVSLVFPIQNAMIAVASGTGVGINALISRRLGQKRREEASQTANVGVFLIVCSYFVFMILGLTCSGAFMRVQTEIPTIVAYGTVYMKIVTVLGFGLFGQLTLERLLQSTGRTIFPMMTQLMGAVLNIIFDPLLIFGIGPFPKLGVAGAAFATVLGQWVAMILAIIFNYKYNHDIRLDVREMRPRGTLIKEIYKISIPSMLMMSIGSVMTFGINKILLGFTSTAIAVFGAYFKIQSVVFMPLFGMNNAMIPIVGYNFGAGRKDRIQKAYKIGCMYGCIFMWIGFAIMQILPAQLLGFFNASENMLEIGIPAFRIISIIFLVAGISVISGAVFQATGKSMYSLIVSFIRQLVVTLPAAYLLSLTGKLNYVWFCLPIAEVFGFTVTVILMVRLMRRLDNMMQHI